MESRLGLTPGVVPVSIHSLNIHLFEHVNQFPAVLDTHRYCDGENGPILTCTPQPFRSIHQSGICICLILVTDIGGCSTHIKESLAHVLSAGNISKMFGKSTNLACTPGRIGYYNCSY